MIELDIRNFKFYDESLDKKKYLIRMQSKPSASGAHLATLGNELNLDDAHEKLTSSGSSSAAEPQTPATSTSSPSCGPYTEILFKTKSSNEMKRLFGLLQWKDSLNYDDNVSAQLSILPLSLSVSLYYNVKSSTGTAGGQAASGATENGSHLELFG